MPTLQSTTEGAGTAPLAITKPTGLEEGDLMIAILAAQQGSGSTDVTNIGAPAGWTLFVNHGGDRNTQHGTGYYKIADSDDVAASNFSFTSGGGSPIIVGSISRITGGNYANMNIGLNGANVASYDSDNLLVFPVVGSDAQWDAGSMTFSGYGVTGGLSPTFTEVSEQYTSPGDGVVGSAIAHADYASDVTITNYTVTVSSGGTHEYERALFLIPPAEMGVQTDPVSDITKVSATLNGEITDVGQTDVTERGFVISTSSHADPGNVSPAASSYESVENETGNFSAGTFTEALAGLDDGTTYYVRVYAEDTDGYLYGEEVSFETDLQKLEIHGRNYVA